MNRRHFIKASTFIAASVSVFGCAAKAMESIERGDDTCDPTTKDILGPFYRKNAPFRTELRLDDEEGITMIVKGRVNKGDCTPAKNALVEVWQANTSGEYDNKTDDYNYRASMNTNENGEYEFTTYIPGRYLNGGQYRPSHIHFRVSAEGQKELISQIYFKDDPYIEDDPWAGDSSAKNRILDQEDKDDGSKEVWFEIALASS